MADSLSRLMKSENEDNNNSKTEEYVQFVARNAVPLAISVTTPGMDGLPHWFLRQAAPSICSPITHKFNLSLLTSTVPCQWKTSVITPVAKIKQPTQCSDYRPISISPILSRLLEKIVVRDCIYPIFTHSTTRHLFQDQVCLPAYRVTNSGNNPPHPTRVRPPSGAPIRSCHCLRFFQGI